MTQIVKAIEHIADSPLADGADSGRRGEVGTVEDIADGFLLVSFGDRDAICVELCEVRQLSGPIISIT